MSSKYNKLDACAHNLRLVCTPLPQLLLSHIHATVSIIEGANDQANERRKEESAIIERQSPQKFLCVDQQQKNLEFIYFEYFRRAIQIYFTLLHTHQKQRLQLYSML